MFQSSSLYRSKLALLASTAAFTLGLSAACGGTQDSDAPIGGAPANSGGKSSGGTGGKSGSGGTTPGSSGGSGNSGGEAPDGGRTGAGGRAQSGGAQNLGGADDGTGGRFGPGSGGAPNSEDCPDTVPEADSECTPPDTSGAGGGLGGPGGNVLACTYDTERCTCRTRQGTSTWRCFTPGEGGPGSGAGGGGFGNPGSGTGGTN
jgi:hypothetical protein